MGLGSSQWGESERGGGGKKPAPLFPDSGSGMGSRGNKSIAAPTPARGHGGETDTNSNTQGAENDPVCLN